MRTRRIVACVFTVLAIGTTVYADTADRRTYFTFNQPVSLPGVTLPAGTYMFRIADDVYGRTVVNVRDASGTRSYALLTSIPATRSDVSDGPSIEFRETVAGAPVAIRSWWYPGQTTGYEFVYRPEQVGGRERRSASATMPHGTDQPKTRS